MTGERDVLAFTVGERENQAAWEDLFDQLKRRGVENVGLWITDGHPAMLNALALKFPDCRFVYLHRAWATFTRLWEVECTVGDWRYRRC